MPSTLQLSKMRFWDRKISGWDEARYSQVASQSELSPSASVEARLRLTTQLLGPLVGGRSVLDLGCGTGRLFLKLDAYHPREMTGWDFSETAIALARRRILTNPATFLVADISHHRLPATDFAVGLGLLDWLTDAEIQSLFRSVSDRKFVFSFSERTAQLSRYAHVAYVWLAYAWRWHRYRPRYQSPTEVQALAQSSGVGKLWFFRHPALSFGCLVANFQLELPHAC